MRGPWKATDASEHLDRLVREDETLTWHATPDKRAFYASGILKGLFSAAFVAPFVAVPVSFVLGMAAVALAGEGAVAWTLGGMLALAVVSVPVLVWAAVRRRYELAEFAVTDDRVIETGGLFGRDASTVSLEDVRDIDVSVGLLGTVFGTGTLSFQTAGGSDAGASFSHVPDPYEALERIETARHDAGHPRAGARPAPGGAAPA